MSTSPTQAQTGVDAHDSAGIASHASDLVAAGDSFAVQYIGTDPSTEDGGSSVTPAQVQADLNGGLQIVSVFETNSMSSTVYKTGTATFGWETYLTEAQGQQDAAAAYAASEAVGQPSGSAIYFAMDFDPAATDGSIDEATALSRVDAYFTGIQEYIATVSSGPTYEVGVYGAGATLQSVSEAGLAQFTWLARSTGWTGYTINAADGPTHGWSMIQSPEAAFDGVPVNQDLTESSDFGAWSSSSGAPCYVTGTRILTDRGELGVEDLLPGDRVVLAAGGTAPVVWLGHRRVNCRRHPHPERVWPVRVRAGAFGLCLPQRDLLLSPDHALFLNAVLIPVKYLLNGVSIVQEPSDSVTYWHVELDRHHVIIAEGLPCESFLDTGNRSAFGNAAAAVQLHPDFALRRWDGDACAPLVMAGPQLQLARATLVEPLPHHGRSTRERRQRA